MADDIVVLRTYLSEYEARLAATILEANDIPAQVLADNAGGAYPSMALVFPVQLLVRADDAAAATEILDVPVSEDEDASGGPT